MIDRTFAVIEVCARSGRPITLAELQHQTGLPKPTLHRVCWKLAELGVLAHTDEGFQVGIKLFEFGGMSAELRRLRAVAMPLLHELVNRTGWATNLAVHADGRALLVEEVLGASGQVIPRRVGLSLPLHATAIGKALLCGYTADELDLFIEQGPLRPYTRTTIVRPNLLREHIQKARRRGFAESHEEMTVGTAGVAAPILVDSQLVGAVAAVGAPDERQMAQRAQYVQRAALRISRDLSRAGASRRGTTGVTKRRRDRPAAARGTESPPGDPVPTE